MAKKKLSTQEILAAARAEAARNQGDAASEEGETAEQPAENAAAESPEEPSQTPPAETTDSGATAGSSGGASGGERPKSTKDILAAARAQAAQKSGEATQGESQPPPEAEGSPAASKPAAGPSGKPKSTKDILAAARAQAASGGGQKPSGSKSSPKAPASGGGAGKPKSTKDILAAARAQAGGGKEEGPKGAPAEKPRPSAEAGQTGAEASTEGLSVQEMLEAVRKGKSPEEAKPSAKPAAPPIPKKPQPAKGTRKSEQKQSRRMFLALLVATPFALAWTFFSVTGLAWLLALARFMMPNVLVEPPSKFKVGPPSDYPPGTVATKWKSQYGIWVVHANYEGQNIIYALISVCTHLGCTPNWLEGEQKFKCPCHGSGFYITGINFEGPAPRPLERAAVHLAPDGMLEVDKSQHFQQELGQWDDTNSKVAMA